jgi:hypothetical protein
VYFIIKEDEIMLSEFIHKNYQREKLRFDGRSLKVAFFKLKLFMALQTFRAAKVYVALGFS